MGTCGQRWVECRERSGDRSRFPHTERSPRTLARTRTTHSPPRFKLRAYVRKPLNNFYFSYLIATRVHPGATPKHSRLLPVSELQRGRWHRIVIPNRDFGTWTRICRILAGIVCVDEVFSTYSEVIRWLYLYVTEWWTPHSLISVVNISWSRI